MTIRIDNPSVRIDSNVGITVDHSVEVPTTNAASRLRLVLSNGASQAARTSIWRGKRAAS